MIYWEERAKRHGSLAAHRLDPVLSRHEESFQRRAVSKVLGDVSGKSLLDAGCGTGDWSRYFAARGAIVTGVDISRNMIRTAKATPAAQPIEYHSVALQDISFAPESFDLVVSITALQHITDPKEFEIAATKLVRVLKNRAVMALIEFSPKRVKKGKYPSYVHYRSRSEWIEVFQSRGLELVSDQPIFFVGFRPLSFLKRLFVAPERDERTAGVVFKGSRLGGIAKVAQRSILMASGMADSALARIPPLKGYAHTRLLVFRK